LGIGGEPNVLTADAADRTACRAQGGGINLVGGLAMLAGDQHGRIEANLPVRKASGHPLMERKPCSRAAPGTRRASCRCLCRAGEMRVSHGGPTAGIKPESWANEWPLPRVGWRRRTWCDLKT